MELRDRLEICRRCTNRKFQENGPILCSLTNEIPQFEITCHLFLKDENEPEKRLDDHDTLTFEEIQEKAEPILFEKLNKEQDFNKALIYGLLACLVSSVLWAAITFLIKAQIGFMALGVGALVGLAIKFGGKGITIKFAILGAVISVLGCVFGNIFTIIAFASKELEVSFFKILFNLDLNVLMQSLVETFQIVDLVFYGLAISIGFKISTLKFTEKSLWQASMELKRSGIY